ncbi:MAG: hypothetical protein Q4P05_05410 [Actinomycetaceae bacterium]|nr:hypothetical protein [Actinomycetaceae bacterium]
MAHDLWSASTLGWILGVRTVGFVIAVPIGGVLADQMSRSRVTFLSGTLATIATVMLAHRYRNSQTGRAYELQQESSNNPVFSMGSKPSSSPLS